MKNPDESIYAYVTALRNLEKTCNFCDCLNDSLLRDRIVLGIQSQHTRKRLVQDRKLTFKGKWQQKFLSAYLKQTPKQYIEVYYRTLISALFGEIF